MSTMTQQFLLVPGFSEEFYRKQRMVWEAWLNSQLKEKILHPHPKHRLFWMVHACCLTMSCFSSRGKLQSLRTWAKVKLPLPNCDLATPFKEVDWIINDFQADDVKQVTFTCSSRAKERKLAKPSIFKFENKKLVQTYATL